MQVEVSLDADMRRALAVNNAYLALGEEHVPGVIHDAWLRGLLDVWASSGVPMGDVLRSVMAVPVEAAELVVLLEVTDRRPEQVAAIAKAKKLLSEWGLSAEYLPALYRAAVRLGLAKFEAQIRQQRGEDPHVSVKGVAE